MFIIIVSGVDDCGELFSGVYGKFHSKDDGLLGFKNYMMDVYEVEVELGEYEYYKDNEDSQDLIQLVEV